MYTRRNYSFWLTFRWSQKPFYLGALYGLFIGMVSFFFDLHIAVPWSAITVIGIAVAFYLGFKNNSAYDRTWEARKIWGSIVNNSRTFGAAVVSFLQGEDQETIKGELIHRHIAWMTALRHQLRLSKPWEHVRERLGFYQPTICEDYHKTLGAELMRHIGETEAAALRDKTNMATQVLKNQSKRLQELHDQGYFNDFRHMRLHDLIQTFYEDQGKSERIKNFPFPRQYASTALWITYVFAFFVPFGLLDIFSIETGWTYWLMPLISGIIIWVFFLMEKIGDYSENPFEGTYNDVPITQIARGIEIDLCEMVDDEEIPAPFVDDRGFLM
ncbi:MAG: bestrophin family ion channel [Bacteroidota bacterium]